MLVNIVILWAACSFFLRPHYRALFFPLNGTSANDICETGAKAGKQVCRRTRLKCYTETTHFSGRTLIPPSLMTVDRSVRWTWWLCFWERTQIKRRSSNVSLTVDIFCLFLQLRSASFTECILNLFSFKKRTPIHVFVKVTQEICPP